MKFIEIGLIIFGFALVLFYVHQVLIPWVTNRPLFPWFDDRKAKAMKREQKARESAELADQDFSSSEYEKQARVTKRHTPYT